MAADTEPTPTPTPTPEPTPTPTPAPATAPTPAPADPALAAELARLQAHKVTMDREAEKLRKEKAETAAKLAAAQKALKEVGLDTGDDIAATMAKKAEAERESREAKLVFKADLFAGVLGAGLTFVNGDSQYLMYRAETDPEFAPFFRANDVPGFLSAATAKGLVAKANAAAPVPAPSPTPTPVPTPTPLPNPKSGAAPADTTAIDGVKSYEDYLRLPLAMRDELRSKFGPRVETLRAAFSRKVRVAQ